MSRTARFSLGDFLLLALALIPSVSAATFDGVSRAMSTAWSAIGSVFSFNMSPTVQEGVLKFLIFILVFRAVMSALQRVGQDNTGSWFGEPKTAGIIGFVVASVTVFFTPNVFIFSSIILLLVPLLLAIGAYYWVFKKTNPVPPALAALILFILLSLLEFLQQSVYKASNVAVTSMYPFTNTVMDLLVTLTGILFIWKLFQMLFSIGSGITGGEGIVGALRKAGEIADAAGILNRKLKRPSTVSGIKVEQVVEAPIKLKVSWDPNPAEENIKEYQAEWSYARNWLTTVWIRIGRTMNTSIEFGNVEPQRHIIVRVAAINNLGMLGPWGTIRRTSAGEIGPMLFEGELRNVTARVADARRALENANRLLTNVGALNADGTLKDTFPQGIDPNIVGACAHEIDTATTMMQAGLSALENVAHDNRFATINETELSMYSARLADLRDLSLRLAFVQRAGRAVHHEVS